MCMGNMEVRVEVVIVYSSWTAGFAAAAAVIFREKLASHGHQDCVVYRARVMKPLLFR